MRVPGWKQAIWNAVFALVVLAIAGFGIISISSRQWQWQETFLTSASFDTIAGVEAGASVLVQGMNAGVVEEIKAPLLPGGPVTLVLRLDAKLQHLVRSDAIARIATQGVVGSKVVELLPGKPDAPPLAKGAVLLTERPIELSDLLARASTSLDTIDSVALAAREGLTEINDIASTIRRGEGTLGKLVKDDEAYQQVLALSERGEKTLTDLEDNLLALKSTWPISSYFDKRGFTDADRVLYQPNAKRDSRVFETQELFEPGRAILTREGRRRLDELAAWFKKANHPETTRIVVAAFTDQAPEGKEELAQVLTQEQADSIRSYLVNQHGIDRLPWYKFSRRAVAAVGYGTQTPVDGRQAPPAPSSRVEFIVFTPQET